MTKDKIKNYLIIALVGVIVLFGLFGGRKVKKFNDEIAALRFDKVRLELLNTKLETDVKLKQDTIKKKDVRIAELMKLFQAKDKEADKLAIDLQKALATLTGITSDSSYQFLQRIAYNYPGELRYLFNQLQVKGIHSDYLVARSSEQTIPLLNAQINNAKEQFLERDNIEAGLKQIVTLKEQQLANCELINSDNNGMIKDLTEQRNKERHRKNFWRFSASVMTGVTVVIAAFGL
jgi:hypothetical protein